MVTAGRWDSGEFTDGAGEFIEAEERRIRDAKVNNVAVIRHVMMCSRLWRRNRIRARVWILCRQ